MGKVLTAIDKVNGTYLVVSLSDCLPSRLDSKVSMQHMARLNSFFLNATNMMTSQRALETKVDHVSCCVSATPSWLGKIVGYVKGEAQRVYEKRFHGLKDLADYLGPAGSESQEANCRYLLECQKACASWQGSRSHFYLRKGSISVCDLKCCPRIEN